MKSIKLLLIVTVGSLFLLSCGEESSDPTGSGVFTFDSLVSESYQIYFLTNPSTEITAYTTGEGLTYRWEATAGEIFGSGNKVTYTSNPACCGGYQSILCQVSNQNDQNELKEIEIYVDF